MAVIIYWTRFLISLDTVRIHIQSLLPALCGESSVRLWLFEKKVDHRHMPSCCVYYWLIIVRIMGVELCFVFCVYWSIDITCRASILTTSRTFHALFDPYFWTPQHFWLNNLQTVNIAKFCHLFHYCNSFFGLFFAFLTRTSISGFHRNVIFRTRDWESTLLPLDDNFKHFLPLLSMDFSVATVKMYV